MKSTSFYSYLLIAVLSSQTKKTEWRNSGRNFKKLFVLTNACRCANNQVPARLLYYLLIPGMKWIFITCIDRHYGVIKCCTDYQGPPMSTYRTDKKQTATVIYRTNFITFAECDDRNLIGRQLVRVFCILHVEYPVYWRCLVFQIIFFR
jgi:hypothetical protein